MGHFSKLQIPATASLALGTLTACADPVVGDWELTERTYNGLTYKFPAVYAEENYGNTYAYVYTVTMSIEADMTGVLTAGYHSEINGIQVYDDAYDYGITVEKQSSSTCVIRVDDGGIAMSCTKEEDQLSCAYLDYDLQAEFQR